MSSESTTTSTTTSDKLPPAAVRVAGVRLAKKHRDHSPEPVDDTATAITQLEQALNPKPQPTPNPTPSASDEVRNPKLNASTYSHPQPKHDSNHSNQSGSNRINQPGGAYGSNRNHA